MPEQTQTTTEMNQVNTPQVTKFVHLYVWESPDRFWTPKSRNWYLTYALVFIVCIFLATLTEQYVLILALIALLFLIYTQGSVPPRTMRHEITNRGLKTFDQLFKWKDVDYFWITEKYEEGLIGRLLGNKNKYRQINFDMTNKPNKRLSLLLGKADEETIIFTLLEYIPYGDSEEVADDLVSQLIYGKHIPLKDYVPEVEYYPADGNYPAQTIVHQDTDAAPTAEDIRKEEKRQSQAQAVVANPSQSSESASS